MDQTNAGGGALVKPFGKKIPLKLISYDDQSNPGDRGDAVQPAHHAGQGGPAGRRFRLGAHRGRGADRARAQACSCSTRPAPGRRSSPRTIQYIALLADPVSTHLAAIHRRLPQGRTAPPAGIKRVALLYATNDFTGTQANALRGFLKEPGSPLEIVYDQGVPTNTSNYTVLINNIAAANPDAVMELGYVGNDIAFLRNLQDSRHEVPLPVHDLSRASRRRSC